MITLTMRHHVRPILHLEGAAIAGAAIWLYAQSGAGWGAFALLILAPDLFMLGYLRGPGIGAMIYNLGHSYATPLALGAIGHLAGLDWAFQGALIWIAHIGIDRAVGYGLKYGDHFKHTHFSRV